MYNRDKVRLWIKSKSNPNFCAYLTYLPRHRRVTSVELILFPLGRAHPPPYRLSSRTAAQSNDFGLY